VILVHDVVGRFPKAARLLHIADDLAGRRLDHELMSATLATAREPAMTRATLELPLHAHHLLPHVVEDFYLEASLRTATHAHARVRLLDGKVDLLLGRVVHHVLVVGVPADERFEHAHLLLHVERIDLSEVLEAGRAAGYGRWSLHHGHFCWC